MKSEILIIGAGLVGTAQAIALAREGISVTLIERQTRARSFDTNFDGRASAIARSSQYVFEHIGVWEAMREKAEPIRDIRVVDAYSQALVHYDHTKADGQPFGHIIPNTHLLPTLLAAAEALDNSGTISPPFRGESKRGVGGAAYPHPGPPPEGRGKLTLLFETELLGLQTDAGGITATLSGGRTCRASLLLAADGRFSKTREMLGLKAKVVTYGQTAMVSVIRHSKPHHGLALERFMPSGPFAVLPMQQDRSGVVWSEPDEVATLMMKLTDAEYAEEIRQRAGEYLGEIAMKGKRFSYPLSIVLTRHYTAPRAALIGDSAHAMHPIAGQGVNVGYRDVAALTEVLVEAKRLGLDLGAASLLQRYERHRRVDVMSMLAATDGINRLFSNNSPLLKLARRIGLSAVERAPSLKSYFMFHAMGLTGDLPDMLKRDVA